MKKVKYLFVISIFMTAVITGAGFLYAQGAPEDCYVCRYSKVVNFVLVDDVDLGIPDCGNCGVYINSYTIVNDFGLEVDVVECWDYVYYSTLIQLSSFSASASNKTVILHWTTESETDNAGFNLYRAESADDEYVKINRSLIPAEGSPTQSASYQFIDEGVKNRTTYYYKLEDIDLNGKSTFHGPMSATPRAISGIDR